MQDKTLVEAIDRALVRFVTDRLTEEIRNDILTAIKEAGYAVVPREPTREMLQAAAKVGDDAAIQNYGGRPDDESIWDAMITAGEE